MKKIIAIVVFATLLLTCISLGLTACGHQHQLVHHPAIEPTCTEVGTGEYWSCECGKIFSDESGTQEIEQISVVQATGHAYGTVTYTWSADHSSCSASRSCACGDAKMASATVQAKVTQELTETQDEFTTYTAIFSEEWADTQVEVVKTNVCLDPSQPDIGGW